MGKRFRVSALAALVASLCTFLGLAGLGRAAPRDPARLHALLINGGATPRENYASHLEHLKQALAVLDRARVPRANVTILSSDGQSPAPDLATKSGTAPPGAWLLSGTGLSEVMDPGLTLVDSRIEGAKLLPATKRTLRTYFETAAKALRPGDTLFLFVTDHGTNPSVGRRSRQRQAGARPAETAGEVDPYESRIMLWGEELSVRELQQLLNRLPAGVRTVAVMSQCFSGGFAQLYATGATTSGAPTGAACGYFSSTADRPAYGCYPENRGENGVGHAFHFLRALEKKGSAALAHLDTLVADDSPDVPLRSSDVFFENLLAEAAVRKLQPIPDLVAELLGEALKDRAPWQNELRLLDRMAAATGMFSPRTLEEVDTAAGQLRDILESLENQLESWESAFGDMASSNLERFLAEQPDWQQRLRPAVIRGLSPEQRADLSLAFLAEFEPYSARQSSVHERLRTLDERVGDVEAVAYRLNIRLAALLRMRAQLMTIAARTYLRTSADEKLRRAAEALLACEQLELAVPPPPPPSAIVSADNTAAPLPPLQQDLEAAQLLLPGYLGIQFDALPAQAGRRLKLGGGASIVRAVLPDSPAARAGLRPGDIIVGQGDEPFTERNQIRVFTMLSPVGKPARLALLRDGQPLDVEVTLGAYPRTWPRPPSRPNKSDIAPALSGLRRYRGEEPARLARGTPYLLYFWATWCGPCKAALPELLDYSRESGTPVLAITDEAREVLDQFFARFENPFVANVAIDELRTTSIAYAVSATPTFVLVGGDGRIQETFTGYHPGVGLGIEGWRWAGRRASP